MSADACKPIGLLLGSHLDGELEPVKTLEVEGHVASCEICRERLALDRALRGSMKRSVRRATPDDVRARVLSAMGGELARQASRGWVDAPAPFQPIELGRASALPKATVGPSLSATGESTAAEDRKLSVLRHWRTFLPLASAAALVLAWGAAARQPVIDGMLNTVVPAGLNDDLLRDFVAQHSRPVPPEQQDPTQVRQFERYVGVPVRVRQQITQSGGSARFVGGRLVPVHGGERAAMLQYEMQQTNGGVQRMTLFVYDPRKVQIGGSNLAPRAVGTAEVRVGRTDGYSVAVTQHGGVGYALASDLDAESSANLVAAVERD